MKKFLCLVFVVALLSTVALAESLDISSLSDDDLLALKTQVDQAISDRGLITETLLPSGHFTAGVDIAPGTYVVHVPGKNQHNARLSIYAQKDDLENGEPIYERFISSQTDEYLYIALNEGNVLDFFAQCRATIEKASMIG